MRKLIVNRWKSPNGEILESRSRHDIVFDSSGNFIDGGIDGYVRLGGSVGGWESLCVYSDDPHEKIREVLSWGSYGRDGKQEKRYILLKCLTDEHLYAILRTQSHIKDTPIEKVLKDEQEYRKVNEIVIKE